MSAGVTRSAFLARSAFAVGAAYGAGAVTPFVSRALAGAGDDREILAFALSLEQVEAAFYKAGLARAGLSGEARSLATTFGAHEAEHVKALTSLLTQLGVKPAAAPSAKFGGLTDQASFLRLAVTLEDTGVAAYNGAAPLVKTPDIVAALGTIVNVEGRHSAALRMAAGQDPAPSAFDKGKGAPAVNAAVRPYLA